MDLSKNAQQVFDLVKELSAIELAQLVKKLEEEFGVSAVAVSGVASAGGADEWASTVKDTLSVELTEVGQQKISVIKVVKEIMNVDLKVAKETVEKAPVLIKENIKQEEADALKAKLEEAGASVSFK